VIRNEFAALKGAGEVSIETLRELSNLARSTVPGKKIK
jgi:hypothetical protein